MPDSIDWIAIARVTLLGIISLALWQLLDLIRYRCFGTRTTGRVIKLEEQECDEGRPVFAPIVQYHAADQSWRLKSLIAMYPSLYHEGQEVPVYYFAANPSNGRVVTPREFFKWIVMAASCVLFLAVLSRT